MQQIFELNKFETRANRPLFTGDIDAYLLRVKLPQEVSNGTVTTASYRPGAKEPVLDTENFSGDICDIVLKTSQYDTVGETKILCSVTDVETGGILTVRAFYATVLTGLAGGTPAKNEYADLTEIIAKANIALSECNASSEQAIQAAEKANEAAEAAMNLPLRSGAGENSLAGGAAPAENVTGKGSLAYGTGDNQVSGNYSYAFGVHNLVSAVNGFAAGSWNSVSGKYGTAFGEGNVVRTERGTAFGDHLRVYDVSGQAVFGKYNEAGNYIFAVGNGTDDNSRSNAVEVSGDGTVKASSLNIANGNIVMSRERIVIGAEYGGLIIGGNPNYGSLVSISDLKEPTADTDAATKKYVDNAINAAVLTALSTAV